MSRQAQCVHKTFYRLKLRANFFVGAKLFEKTSFCTARQLCGTVFRIPTPVKFIAPWTVVRSDEYVNKKLIAAKVRARSGDGHTHYVGDDCPGGHCEVEHGAPAPTIVPPNNDNNITGPTS